MKTLSARTTMEMEPEDAPRSTVTTGMPAALACSMAGTMASLSTGTTIRPLTPRPMRVWMSVVCLAASAFALTAGSRLTPCSSAWTPSCLTSCTWKGSVRKDSE
jgi:hypothetical protein